jgi:hypothetical protein
MKTLTVALLLLGTFAPTPYAQSAEQALRDRRKVLGGWLAMIKTAETKYKGKYGRYGELTDLRKAHLLDTLFFESEASAETHSEAEANFVPKSTSFQVTVSTEGQHFKVAIHEDETSSGSMIGRPAPRAPIEDIPDRPIFARPTLLRG